METFLLWLRGLIAAFIQGGATAVVASVSANMIAPDKFNLGDQLHNFLTLAITMFVFNGVMGAFSYLKQSPLPLFAVKETNITTNTTEKTTMVTPAEPPKNP